MFLFIGVCVSVCHVCVRGHWVLWTGTSSICELFMWVRELNSGPSEEQQALFAVEPPLQPPKQCILIIGRPTPLVFSPCTPSLMSSPLKAFCWEANSLAWFPAGFYAVNIAAWVHEPLLPRSQCSRDFSSSSCLFLPFFLSIASSLMLPKPWVRTIDVNVPFMAQQSLVICFQQLG